MNSNQQEDFVSGRPNKIEERDIIVKHSGLVRLESHGGDSGGLLVVGEKEGVPFPVKRFYFITDLKEAGERGGHAHKETDQVIFCQRGSFELTLDDGEKQQSLFVNDPTVGVRLGPGLWHGMRKFSPDCLILVLASDVYEAGDYLREYDEFLKFINDKV